MQSAWPGSQAHSPHIITISIVLVFCLWFFALFDFLLITYATKHEHEEYDSFCTCYPKLYCTSSSRISGRHALFATQSLGQLGDGPRCWHKSATKPSVPSSRRQSLWSSCYESAAKLEMPTRGSLSTLLRSLVTSAEGSGIRLLGACA